MVANASFASGPMLGMLVYERFGVPLLWVSVFIACAVSAPLFLRIAPIGGRLKASAGTFTTAA